MIKEFFVNWLERKKFDNKTVNGVFIIFCGVSLQKGINIFFTNVFLFELKSKLFFTELNKISSLQNFENKALTIFRSSWAKAGLTNAAEVFCILPSTFTKVPIFSAKVVAGKSKPFFIFNKEEKAKEVWRTTNEFFKESAEKKDFFSIEFKPTQ